MKSFVSDFCERQVVEMNRQDQLIEFITQDIIEMITIDQGVEYDEAMNKFYYSEVFDKLKKI